jgi:hypothetical protein
MDLSRVTDWEFLDVAMIANRLREVGISVKRITDVIEVTNDVIIEVIDSTMVTNMMVTVVKEEDDSTAFTHYPLRDTVDMIIADVCKALSKGTN